MRRFVISLLIIILVLVPPLAIPQQRAVASTVSASEIISLVNSLRSGYGLPALIIDPILNSTAASTAYSMAASGVCAHIGGARERIAAAGFGGGSTIFATENMACANSATIDWIRQVWADEVHMWPMTEARYTHVGAGTYTASSGTTYYVLHAAYIADGSTSYNSGSTSSTSAPANTIQYVVPVFTVTPNSDGSIIHTVKYGQTLFALAIWYNVSIDALKTLNGLTSNVIYEGQSLTIKAAPTATITPTKTATQPRPTRTPTLTKVPLTATPRATNTPTQVPGMLSNLPRLDRQWMGLSLIVLSAAGLLVVLFFSFIKPAARKK